MPDWIELKGPQKTGQQGLAWTFTVRADRPADLSTSIRFECDTGVGSCQISLKVHDGQPALGELVLCDSPFACHTSHHSLDSLVRIAGALPFRWHCVGTVGEIGEVLPRTLVLHQGGLLRCNDGDVGTLRELVASGGNLVVLADEFFRGTTTAANRVLAPFGIRMKQDGRDEPGLSRQEQIHRILAWQERYEQTPFDSGPAETVAHPLTRGVKKVHWWRPCPLVCTGPGASPLVRNPADTEECFAAVAQPGGYVVVVGTSLWTSLSAVGWPYDNDRLLANLLVGGDAESAVG